MIRLLLRKEEPSKNVFPVCGTEIWASLRGFHALATLFFFTDSYSNRLCLRGVIASSLTLFLFKIPFKKLLGNRFRESLIEVTQISIPTDRKPLLRAKFCNPK